MKGEPLKGHLDLLILATLAAAPAHGYALIEALRLKSGGAFDLAEGTIYPVLHRLEAAGFLKSRWTVARGRRRRIYSLSSRGRTALARQGEEWRAFSGAVSAVLQGGET